MKNNDFIPLLLRLTLLIDRQKDPSWLDLGPSGDPFWEPFWDQIGPRSQDEPKRAIKSPKVTKTYKTKKLKKTFFFSGFWGSKAFQDSI